MDGVDKLHDYKFGNLGIILLVLVFFLGFLLVEKIFYWQPSIK